MKTQIIVVALALGAICGTAQAKNIYVSRTTGNNKNEGTKESPKKLLWKVMNKLQDGDHLYVAEGHYYGSKKSGVMPKITAAGITIEGGWKADFSERDPFKYLSIISGVKNKQADTREVFQFEDPKGRNEPFVLDGFCIDRGPGLYYKGHGEGGTSKIEGYDDTTCWGY